MLHVDLHKTNSGTTKLQTTLGSRLSIMSAFVPFDNWNDYRTTSLKRVEGKDLSGQVHVVTGATGAMGKEIALALLSANATTILTGRTMAKLEATKKELIEKIEGDHKTKGVRNLLELRILDLGDYDTIEKFSTEIAQDHPNGIDVFINNAGMIPTDTYKASKYGLETTFQANFLSVVLVTEMVLPLIKKKKGRVIHISSLSHAEVPKQVDWSKIPSTRDTFGGYSKDYSESKWLLTTYASMLAERGSNGIFTSVCADPGVSPSSAMWDNQTLLMRVMVRYIFRFLTKSSTQAAACATKLAVAETAELKNGGYYHSGILYPPMREDCQDPVAWGKLTAVLKKSFPDKYHKYAVSVD